MLGRRLGHYEITAHLGSGGMGDVYQATDSRLGRSVAIKFLPQALTHDSERVGRFRREARVLASLNHPNIAAIHGLEEAEGRNFLVMELAEGETLAERIQRGSIPVEEALEIAAQIAEGLEAAHERGIAHRDLKPANVKITPGGRVKVLDFGLAKAFETQSLAAGSSESTTMSSGQTREGVILGTTPYMSPEQVEGKALDARSDVFSLGVVMYEMFCGTRPFHGDTAVATFASILRENPRRPREIRHEIPVEIDRMVMRCLEKDPGLRYPSARELHVDLRRQTALKADNRRPLLRRAAGVAATLAVVAAVGVFGARAYVDYSRGRRAENDALPQVRKLMEESRPMAAFDILREAEKYIPLSPQLIRLKEDLFVSEISIDSNPTGADISVLDFADPGESDPSRWKFIGRTPFRTSLVPRGYYRVRASKEGFDTVERAIGIFGAGGAVEVRLHSGKETPSGMVWVPGITGGNRGTGQSFPAVIPQDAPEFWLDQHEVTNKEFEKFVHNGGYLKSDYWKNAFVKDGKPLSLEAAMNEFRDATGKPGPATWELGTYTESKADFPVGGVSWYEAAAYCESVGKSLPTVYHWFRAIGLGSPFDGDALKLSNFSGKGPVAIKSSGALGSFGTYDMGGNMKEWALNPTGGLRYILGGGWNEPPYQIARPDARRPLDREATFGIRCAKYPAPLLEAFVGPVPFADRDRRNDKPADDQTYRIYLSLHSYDKTALKPTVEPLNEDSPYWRKEKVSYSAAYGDESINANLYLPKGATPPYQVVIYFGGTNTLTQKTFDDEAASLSFGFIIRSGRAVLYPAFKGTLERGPGAYYHQLGQPDRWREMNLQWSKDLGRSIDYLETRQDIDVSRLALFGSSMGAAMSPRLIAVEPRIKVGLLLLGGSFEKVPPEVDSWNFAPRVKIPVLMLNGKDDFLFPLETSQVPLFRALGTPEKDKHHVLYEGGHGWDTGTRLLVIKDALDWLDHYLGPVK